jgi:hypothetical protein
MLVKRSLEWLTRRIEAEGRVRERRSDIFLQSVVGLLSVIVLKDIVFELLGGYPSWQWPAYFIAIAIVVIIFYVHIIRVGKP